MHENETNKVIGYMFAAIVAYYVLQIIVPYLIWGLIGLVVWQIFWACRRGR